MDGGIGELVIWCHEQDIYIMNCRPSCFSVYFTVENSDSWKVRFCTKVQSSQISKLLGIFQDQKMDIISCHDCQFSKCKNQIIRLAWFDFKYKKIHIQRIWDNENEFKKQC